MRFSYFGDKPTQPRISLRNRRLTPALVKEIRARYLMQNLSL